MANMSTNISTFIPMLFLIITLCALYDTTEGAVCKKMSQAPDEKPMVILVHGSTSGGWSWYKLRWILESLDYTVVSPDLKASGIDSTNASRIESFEDYNEPLDRLMASLPDNQKVVLVGHSAGGVSLTKTLHDYPQKILVAIFVCATMLKHGYLTCQDLQNGVPYFSKNKCNAPCPTLPKPTCFDKVILPSKDQIHPIDQTEDTVLAKLLTRPGPYRAILTANFTSRGSTLCIDKVPRVYVKTLLDQTLIPEQQDAMIKLWPPCEVYEIPNGHDILSAKPLLLSSLIINATSYDSGHRY